MPKKQTRRYSTAWGIMSSGVFIQRSAQGLVARPTTMITAPPASARAIAVCTARLTPSASPAP